MTRLLLAGFACSLFAGAAFAADVPQSPSPRAAVSTEYRLGPGDKLRISVFGEDSLSGEFLIPGGAGAIAFPLIGNVAAAGLTVAELEAEIERKLKPDYLKDPRISIEVLTYRPFYILGEVAKPGEYEYTNGLTIFNAVATSGGFTYRANTRTVYIKRAGSDKEVRAKLDTRTTVQPGDTIRVGERFF